MRKGVGVCAPARPAAASAKLAATNVLRFIDRRPRRRPFVRRAPDRRPDRDPAERRPNARQRGRPDGRERAGARTVQRPADRRSQPCAAECRSARTPPRAPSVRRSGEAQQHEFAAKEIDDRAVVSKRHVRRPVPGPGGLHVFGDRVLGRTRTVADHDRRALVAISQCRAVGEERARLRLHDVASPGAPGAFPCGTVIGDLGRYFGHLSIL